MKTLKQFLNERITSINTEYNIPKIELWNDKEQINMWTQEWIKSVMEDNSIELTRHISKSLSNCKIAWINKCIINR